MEHVSPDAVGMDASRLERVRETLERAGASGAFPGGVYGVARDGHVAALEAFGQRDNDPPAPATVDTLYDLASVTKPVACATAAMITLERGLLHAQEEARAFFPEHAMPHWAGITIHHLLTHTSGLPDWKALYLGATDDAGMLASLFATDMKGAPGTRYEYSCLGYIMLGKILERLTGEPLDAFTAREVFTPLGMTRTGYRRISQTPESAPEENVAPTLRSDRERGRLRGHVHDGNASALDGVSGNAGLFGTAADLLRYGQALLNGGALNGARILAPASVLKMLTIQTDSGVGGHTWGFFCAPNGMHPAGDLLWEGSAGHTGFTGTSLVLHPAQRLVAVLLTNRVLYDATGHIRARRVFHNAVAGAIVR